MGLHQTPENTAPGAPASDLSASESTAAPLPSDARRRWYHRIFAHIPPAQFARYLCVGVFNTAFGYTTFAIINFYLRRAHVPASYDFAVAFSSLINITVAYLGYKLFVFRTHGNYLREWSRAMAVAWSGFLPTIILLPLLVRLFNLILPASTTLLHHTMDRKELSPYVANAFLSGLAVIYSFIGHRKVTFRPASA